MRKLVSVVTVENVSAIEGADNIVVVTMAGKCWKVICKKGDFAPGDSAVYFEIDSFIGVCDELEFLRDRCYKKFTNSIGETVEDGYRIKTIKLRGVVSQGLLIPINAETGALSDEGYEEKYNVRHYDEVYEKMMSQPGVLGKSLGNNALGVFPSFIPKTDEERLQNLSVYFNDPVIEEMGFECTHKNDGSSMTVFYSPTIKPDAPYGVCSRNLQLKLDAGGKYTEVAAALKLESALKFIYENSGKEIAVQGELVGPNINGNKDKYTDFNFTVFRIYDITNAKWMVPEERYSLVRMMGLQHVPVVIPYFKDGVVTEYRTVDPVKYIDNMWPVQWFKLLTNMDEFLAFVDTKTIHGNPLEGMVWKSIDGTVSFKVINNRYLLKNE